MVWATGQKLQGGKYVIQGVLGQGGFGITYKARHVSLNHDVVIKTPNEYLQYEPDYHKYVARFIEEAQILARLSRDPHPSIVGVHDLFQEKAIYCLVMNFVEGKNLFELVRRRGAIPEAEAVRYICQIGEALAVVHQVGLTHRDAHPGNILLRQNGKAVLIDFGIAKELVPSTYTSTGAVGNEGFAPYEQVHRGSREPNVDVHCLAATLYYTLTGQCPTKGLDRKLYQQPLIEPRQIVPGISKQVNRAILKGMALEPKKRPQSMQAWLKLLEIPTVLTPPPVHEQEFFRPSANQTSRQPFRTASTRKARTIPWVRLTVIAGCYLGIGFFLVEVGAVAVAVLGAVAAAAAWAVPVAAAVAVAVLGAVAAAMAGAGATAAVLLGAVAVAAAAAVPVAAAGAGAGAGAKEKLQESFSKFHTFLILLGTSWLGLGLGWLLGSIF
ncbi:MAG: serine/threonine-protein kinase [Coleofasciculus sp. B1-GNL1-01]|uniref:serine/threonine protein kinase n=1 Tax=Coleofasciculus sp. B1-GNL1-01 TaxID=3068484 RepID=UPI0032F42BD6